MSLVMGEIAAQNAWSEFEAGRCQLIDVRESGEYDSLMVVGSTSLPLSDLPQKGTQLIDPTRPVYLLCRTGNRARKAAALLSQMGINNHVISGGLGAWIAAGLPVSRKAGAWSMERQVRFTAGALVLLGLVLGTTVNANWLGLSAVVALGMLVSAITDSCGMAMILARLPWNQNSTKSASR